MEKYKLPNGQTLTDRELKELYFSKKPESTELRYEFWKYFKIECGAIQVIKESK